MKRISVEDNNRFEKMRSAVADFINPKKDEKTVEKSADSMDVRRSDI